MTPTTDTYQQSTDGGLTWTPVSFRTVRNRIGWLRYPDAELNRLWDGEIIDVQGTKYRMIETEREAQP